MRYDLLYWCDGHAVWAHDRDDAKARVKERHGYYPRTIVLWKDRPRGVERV